MKMNSELGEVLTNEVGNDNDNERFVDDVVWEMFTLREVECWAMWSVVLKLVSQSFAVLYWVMLVMTFSFNEGLGEAYGATQGGRTCGALEISNVNEFGYTEEEKLTDLGGKEDEEAANDGMGEEKDRIQEEEDSNGDSFG